MIAHILEEKLGFKEQECKVYLALLDRGQASVRTLAQSTGVGRGTVYSILKKLKTLGLVKLATKGKLQYFFAEDPKKILHVYDEKIVELQHSKDSFHQILPELQSLYGEHGEKPKVTYYIGRSGIKEVLDDILFTMKGKTEPVLTYSSAELRSIVRDAYPEYTQKRIDAGISTKVIKLGGSSPQYGLDEIKFLAVDKPQRTYTHIYGNKVSYVTAKSSGHVLCVVIEDESISSTQRFLFESLWEYLPNVS